MQYSTIQVLFGLGLLNAASAIDIYLWNGACYTSASHVCTNWNPNSCCAGPGAFFFHAGARAVPSGWRIDMRGHVGGGCGPLGNGGRFTGPADICIGTGTGGAFTGAGYGFWGKKRDLEGVVEGSCDAAAVPCKETRAPDQVHFPDGAKYNLVGMEPAVYQELLDITLSGANSSAAVPAHFNKYLVN